MKKINASPHTGGGNPTTRVHKGVESLLLPTLVGVILVRVGIKPVTKASPHTGGGNPPFQGLPLLEL